MNKKANLLLETTISSGIQVTVIVGCLLILTYVVSALGASNRSTNNILELQNTISILTADVESSTSLIINDGSELILSGITAKQITYRVRNDILYRNEEQMMKGSHMIFTKSTEDVTLRFQTDTGKDLKIKIFTIPK